MRKRPYFYVSQPLRYQVQILTLRYTYLALLGSTFMFHNPYVTDPHSALHVLGPTWLYFYGSQPLWDILTLWDRFSRRRRVRHAGTPCLSLACTIQPLLAARVDGHPARRHECEGRPPKNQPDSVDHSSTRRVVMPHF